MKDRDDNNLRIWDMLSPSELAIILRDQPDAVVPRLMRCRRHRIAEARALKNPEPVAEPIHETIVPVGIAGRKITHRIVRRVTLTRGGKSYTFNTDREAAAFLGVSAPWVHSCIHRGRPIAGYRIVKEGVIARMREQRTPLRVVEWPDVPPFESLRKAAAFFRVHPERVRKAVLGGRALAGVHFEYVKGAA